MQLAAPPPDLEPHARHTASTDAATAAANSSDADAAYSPDAATVAAIKAMADSATVWARDLIDSTRGPGDPDRHTFPTLDNPPLVPVDFDYDALPPRSDFRFSDDENDAEPHRSSDEE